MCSAIIRAANAGNVQFPVNSSGAWGGNNMKIGGLADMLMAVLTTIDQKNKHAPGMVSKKADYKDELVKPTYVRDEGPGVKTPRKNSAEARLGRRARGVKRLSSKEAPGTKSITDSLNVTPAGGIQI